jgi:hypothetical protein
MEHRADGRPSCRGDGLILIGGPRDELCEPLSLARFALGSVAPFPSTHIEANIKTRAGRMAAPGYGVPWGVRKVECYSLRISLTRAIASSTPGRG